MQRKLTLALDQIDVKSFETSQKMEAQAAPENLVTCLQTNCGKILCCA